MIYIAFWETEIRAPLGPMEDRRLRLKHVVIRYNALA